MLREELPRVAVSNMRPRRLQAFGVGAAKTGTHSLAAIFGRYRSRHEPEAARLLRLLCEPRALGEVSDGTSRYLRWKDRRLRLEFDSSQLNGPVAHLLADLHPQARFVLTVRHPRTWLESLVNDSLRRDSAIAWHTWRDIRFGGMPYRPQDAPLEAKGLYPLAGYLRYWAWHNRFVRESIPTTRLLVVATEQLNASLPQIAEFTRVPLETLESAHQFAGDQYFGVLDELDPAYLADSINRWCGDEMEALPITLTT